MCLKKARFKNSRFSPFYYNLVVINNTVKNKVLNNVYITKYFPKFLG